MKRNVKPLLAWALFLGLGLSFYYLLGYLRESPKAQGVAAPLRLGFEANEALSKKLPLQKVKEYPRSAVARKVRVNGLYGLKTALDTLEYRLYIIHPETKDTMAFTLEQVRQIPKTEVIFDFKCIEGWNQITWWGGACFRTFVKKHYPDLLDEKGKLRYAYVGLMTPDRQYYVGNDAESMMHPQTLLCYEMKGEPLSLKQGYPLRLIIPVKYGIKHLKRIGYIYFSQTKPRDYWAERGYDYHSGH